MILLIKSLVSGYTRKDGTYVSPHHRRADEFAAAAHAGQYRKGKPGAPTIPYIAHPRAVASILHHEAGITDPVTLMAALLHDTLEDTSVTHAQLAKEFGREVADAVMELTNEPGVPKELKKQAQVARMKKVSERAANIKIADKTANLRDLVGYPPDWSSARKRQYFEDAREVVQAVGKPHPLLQRLFETTYLTGIKHF